MDELDIRDEFIRRVGSGHSFVDIGGLWRVVSEKLSIAAGAGASEVTMFDRAPIEDPDWLGLQRRMSEMGIEYNVIVNDLFSYTSRPFDVVHSSGMLYHMLSPLDYLKKLRTLTNKYAIITSAVTQKVVVNSKGEFRIPTCGTIFLPAVSDSDREVLAEYWRPWGIVTGVTHLRDEFRLETAGWIWLPTAESFKKMVECCRFKIIDEGPYWYGNAYTVLVE